MKRVGLIDNLSHIDAFLADGFQYASAADVMAATGGNTGNVAFVFGTKKMLKNSVTRMGWGWDPKVVNERFDHIVICCANQIGKHVDLGGWADRLQHFNLPVTLLGLGAQSDDFNQFPEIPDGTKRFLELVRESRYSELNPNIAVRGPFTQEVLAEIGMPSVATGCPSLMISPDKHLGASILARQCNDTFVKVAVAAGNPWHAPSALLERVLVDIVDRYNGDYILQHPESMLQVAFGENESIAPNTVSRFLEVYGGRFDLDKLLTWYRRNACVFVDAPNWMRFLSRFDVVLGPRYHGVALGIQASIPGCVIAIDSRTQELCDGTAVKSLTIGDALTMDAKTLVDAAGWTVEDAERFDSNRFSKACDYVDFILANGLAPSPHLVSLTVRC